MSLDVEKVEATLIKTLEYLRVSRGHLSWCVEYPSEEDNAPKCECGLEQLRTKLSDSLGIVRAVIKEKNDKIDKLKVVLSKCGSQAIIAGLTPVGMTEKWVNHINNIVDLVTKEMPKDWDGEPL